MRSRAAGTNPGLERNSRPMLRQRAVIRRTRRSCPQRFRFPSPRPCCRVAASELDGVIPDFLKEFSLGGDPCLRLLLGLETGSAEPAKRGPRLMPSRTQFFQQAHSLSGPPTARQTTFGFASPFVSFATRTITQHFSTHCEAGSWMTAWITRIEGFARLKHSGSWQGGSTSPEGDARESR
jgi:hypothetical protein